MSIAIPAYLTKAGHDVLECITREYFGHKVTAFRTANSQRHYSSFPWCFAIEDADGKVRNFCGIPNLVETRAKALRRGWWRAKWLAEGTWDRHYR